MTDRKWRRILIDYEDGRTEIIDRFVVDKILEAYPILEALSNAKDLREKLNRILGE